MPTTKASAKFPQILKSTDGDFEDQWSAVSTRTLPRATATAAKTAARAIQKVRESGDQALLSSLKKLCEHVPKMIELSREEWDLGCEAVDSSDRAALGKAAMRIREFHRKRIPGSWELREEGGAFMGQRVRPLSSVGIFSDSAIPLKPSQIIMYATPASAVEVPEISLAVAPEPNGTVRPEILMAARVAGIHRIFKMSGVEAVAAFALGTTQVPRVEKLAGPGGPEIEMAKSELLTEAGIMTQPVVTELCVVADKTATPAWLATDLLAHAQTGQSAHGVLITHCKTLPARVQSQLMNQVEGLPGSRKLKQSLSSRFAFVVTRSLAESLELADRYAPENLVAAVSRPDEVVKTVQNAGTILMGHYTPSAVGGVLAGPGSVVPSGGTARFASPLGSEDFLKKSHFVQFEASKLRELGHDAIRLSELDDLGTRGKSVELRLKRIRRARREREVAREAEL
ncbi:MAG: histidinol dehydrogenase [Myxococcota bacterium]|nr:histidinol dehydrogenase [Myxococcota bacterium]